MVMIRVVIVSAFIMVVMKMVAMLMLVMNNIFVYLQAVAKWIKGVFVRVSVCPSCH